MGLFDRARDLLRSARDGATEFLDWYFNDKPGYEVRKEEVVERLRRIPASDTSKKEQLAAFFQSPEGQGSSRAEREQAYNDLLGRERNKENRG
jgi:hypothetical protein